MAATKPAPRSEASIPIFFHGGRSEGEGTIRNLSDSGALIRQASGPIGVGQKVTLELHFSPKSRALPVKADVVRLVNDGFAVRFTFANPKQESVFHAILDLRGRHHLIHQSS